MGAAKNRVVVNEDDLGEVADLIPEVETAIEDLRIAEIVETQAELILNLENALESLDAARKSIAALLAQAKTNG